MAEAVLTPAYLDAQLAPLLDAPHWYVGFSGGIDSTVLLHLLRDWRRVHPGAPPLTAIHVNHALQVAADDWQVHCQWFCRMLEVPLVCARATVERVSGGLEAAAREARYKVFEQQLAPGAVLFLGHHLDDQVETFFLRLLRGAGLQGLAAMPASRSLEPGELARPLLDVPRAQLEQYARDHGLAAVEDPSNEDTNLDRNFLRHQVLPLLESRWPAYRQTVNRASGHIASAAATLAQALPAPDTVRSAMGDPGIPLVALCSPLWDEASLTLRHWLQAACLPAPDRVALEEFLRQLREATQRSRPRLECSAFTLQRYGEAVYLLPDPAPGQAEAVSLQPGVPRELPGAGRLELQPVAADGLLLAPGEQLEVSWRRGGERCRPRGRARSTGLKKLLQEANVPPWWRERVPLLHLDGELLAVGDLWLCESSRWAATAQPGYALWQPQWQRNISTAFD